MKKSKSFWAAASLFSLAVMAMAGYSIYHRMALYFSGDTVSVSPVPPPPVQAEPDQTAAANPVQVPPAEPAAKDKKSPEPAKPEQTAPKIETVKVRAVKTTFEFKAPKARSVEISGSFTSWKPQAMKKKNGIWKAKIYILPGTYPYHFTVDGQKKLDPGKPKAPIGDSLVTVK